ncbi:hypothetical protein JCM10003_958 [Bacteroides pyogenes JCM 10003]|nr:hypothetical protein JCM10003_958 [Bacteroides pyogenes JCM 10003]
MPEDLNKVLAVCEQLFRCISIRQGKNNVGFPGGKVFFSTLSFANFRILSN